MKVVRTAMAVVAVSVGVGLGASACGGSDRNPNQVVTGGDPDVGKREIVQHGCGSCHEIPGVKGADGLVGPPLTKFGRRSFIAGELANTPDNLIRWIRDPKNVEPGTDMPDLGVTTQEARNIAAYLERLG
jgi:cytochrome c1